MSSPFVIKVNVPVGPNAGEGRHALEINLESLDAWLKTLGLNNIEPDDVAVLKRLRTCAWVTMQPDEYPQDIQGAEVPSAQGGNIISDEEFVRAFGNVDVYDTSPCVEVPRRPLMTIPYSSEMSLDITEEDYYHYAQPNDEGYVNFDSFEHRVRTERTLTGEFIPRREPFLEEEQFRYFRRVELMNEMDCVSLDRIDESLKSTECDPQALQGWQFIHDAIMQGLSEAEAAKFPPYDLTQQALLLRMGRLRGRPVIRSARSLDGCSKKEILRLMSGVEECTWDDVIWVKHQDDNIPFLWENVVPSSVKWTRK